MQTKLYLNDNYSTSNYSEPQSPAFFQHNLTSEKSKDLFLQLRLNRISSTFPQRNFLSKSENNSQPEFLHQCPSLGITKGAF